MKQIRMESILQTMHHPARDPRMGIVPDLILGLDLSVELEHGSRMPQMRLQTLQSAHITRLGRLWMSGLHQKKQRSQESTSLKDFKLELLTEKRKQYLQQKIWPETLLMH